MWNRKERNEAVHGRSFRSSIKNRVWIHPESCASPAKSLRTLTFCAATAQQQRVVRKMCPPPATVMSNSIYCDPFFFFRRTERPDRTGTNKVLFDGDWHHCRWRWTRFAHNTLLLCRGMRKRLPFVVIWLARPKILDGSKLDFSSRNGTNGHEQLRYVPSGSTMSSRWELKLYFYPSAGGLKKIIVIKKRSSRAFQQPPYFVQRRSRASGYWRPCSSRVWSASRVGTLPSFFRAGRRLYRNWMVHQCWCSTSTVDSLSFSILAFACHAYPAFVLHPRFPEDSTAVYSNSVPILRLPLD